MPASREAVWLALADLWLDTEITATTLDAIVRTLRDSGLPLAELEQIFYYEVAPVVWRNAWSVAGEWSGFDPQWLREECGRNQQRGRWHRGKCRLLRWPMTYACSEHWQQIRARLAQSGGAPL
jgi:hypothetical protein